jgi:DnaK suppressor protein
MMNGLSAKEVEHLRQRLRDEHAQLRGEVASELARSEQGRYLDQAGHGHDPGAAAGGDLREDLEIAALDRHVHRVRLIEAALAAVDQGRYGLCRVCGEQIGSARLNAEPAAERCIGCQTALESGQHAPTL